MVDGRLELKHIIRDFDGFKIQDLTLIAEAGQYVVIIGPTGAGKTLLLETIQGFHRPDSGEILLDGADITELPQQQRRIAYVPQNPIFPPHSKVSEILSYGVNRYYDDAKMILDGITDLMNLQRHLAREVVTLSGGERRKLALARALIQRPKVLLLDEPLNNLDIISQASLLSEIQMIHEYLDLTTVHVTHDQTEALTMADRLAVIRKGSLQKMGTVEEVYYDPSNEYAARFFGYRNIYPVKEYQHGTPYTKVDIGEITLRMSLVPDEDQTKVAVHGTEVVLHRKMPMNTSDNLFSGAVSQIVTTGPSTYITVDVGEKIVLNMGRRAVETAKLRKCDPVWVRFSTDAVKPIRA
jgi:ABC-type sugar transport system ATPase subunit